MRVQWSPTSTATEPRFLADLDHGRDLGWPGVAGNTDEILFRPGSLTEFASHSPKLQAPFAAIEEMAAGTREALGTERLVRLRGLPRVQVHGAVALVHTSCSMKRSRKSGAWSTTWMRFARFPVAVFRTPIGSRR